MQPPNRHSCYRPPGDAVNEHHLTWFSDGCYRKSLPLEEAVRRIADASERQFDRRLVEQFLPLATREASQVAKIADPFALDPSKRLEIRVTL